MSELRETRLEKARTLADLGQGPYGLRYEPTHRTAALQQAHADLANGQERDVVVAVAGRVMTRRVMGKLAFFTLADETGPIQLYPRKPRWRRPLLIRPLPAPSPTSRPWWMRAI